MVSNVTTRQRGSAMVEVVIAIPFLFLLVFICLELSWAYSRKAEVTSAARTAARTAALANVTYADVEATTARQMEAAGFSGNTWVLELDPSDPAAVEPGSAISATIRADYRAIALGGAGSLFPLPNELTASATMRKEGNR